MYSKRVTFYFALHEEIITLLQQIFGENITKNVFYGMLVYENLKITPWSKPTVLVT
jgi:hypothetical protein